jgi:hypothetical protein
MFDEAMTPEVFAQIFHQQILLCEDILLAKAEEYAPEDRLSNFRTAAELQGVTMPQALAGMMAKHTVSIYDMIGSDKDYTLEQWFEKITDHINYLILLRAIKTMEWIQKTRAEAKDAPGPIYPADLWDTYNLKENSNA